MDEVLDKFSSLITSKVDEAGKVFEFEGLYKNWGKLGNQEQRRKDLLDVQKNNRNSKVDNFRGILELVNSVEEHAIYRHEKAIYRPSIYVAGFTKTSSKYSNVLMLSEWMIEKPLDFEVNWLVVPCPKGVRTLVVANQGTTKCYTKHGHYRFECHTALPGGNPCIANFSSRCCVLDCFYVPDMSTMFVLDLLAWNSQPMTDGETEFRNYWLETQFKEIPELETLNKRNKLTFKLLPKVPCTRDSFDEFMSKFPQFESNSPPMDGLLFYHKKAHYFGGETPLVGWLYPYMVPEVIGTDVKIDTSYMLEKPQDYINQTDFIKKFEEECARKQKVKKGRKKFAMDTSPVLNESNSSDTQTEVMEADTQVVSTNKIESEITEPVESME